ncbi:glycosyltransferase [Fulvivirga imtechensis]|nr:glycosyltransferase [Fulvivirga imtechensis]
MTTLVIDVLLLISWLFGQQEVESTGPGVWPTVSILVAARNEAPNIIRCLDSLTRLEYPADKLEILIGDDASEDDTCQIAVDFARNNTRIKVLPIKEKLGNARGKANVLARLAKEATGDLYFITDADVSVPPGWIKGMLRGARPGVGIVTGLTGVADNKMQHIDWLFALGMVKVITDLKYPVTTMGNNMYVTKEAYQSVGGYETIPFSITEDFELFKQVRKEGYDVVQLYNNNVLAWSKGVKGFFNLLNQRKRWMHGAVQLPWPIVSLLTFQAFYFPAVLSLLFLDPYLATAIFVVKVLVQDCFIVLLHRRLKIRIAYGALLLYEFYSLILSLLSSIFFLIPVKIMWKGRKY